METRCSTEPEKSQPLVKVEIPTRLGYQRAMDDMAPWFFSLSKVSSKQQPPERHPPTTILLAYSKCFNGKKLTITHVPSKIIDERKTQARLVYLNFVQNRYIIRQ